jgi:hypothetical protein
MSEPLDDCETRALYTDLADAEPSLGLQVDLLVGPLTGWVTVVDFVGDPQFCKRGANEIGRSQQRQRLRQSEAAQGAKTLPERFEQMLTSIADGFDELAVELDAAATGAEPGTRGS